MATKKRPSFKTPNKPKADDDPAADRRFEAADKVMSAGGYADAPAADSPAPAGPAKAASKAGKAKNAEKTYPTSWHATHADRIRLNQLQGWLMMQGYKPNKTEILQIALRGLESMSAEEVTRLYDALLAEQGEAEG